MGRRGAEADRDLQRRPSWRAHGGNRVLKGKNSNDSLGRDKRNAKKSKVDMICNAWSEKKIWMA